MNQSYISYVLIVCCLHNGYLTASYRYYSESRHIAHNTAYDINVRKEAAMTCGDWRLAASLHRVHQLYLQNQNASLMPKSNSSYWQYLCSYISSK